MAVGPDLDSRVRSLELIKGRVMASAAG